MKYMKKTSELINQKHLLLKHLAQKINHLRAINQSLQAILPIELRSACEVANLNDQKCLVLLTHNSHWLTSLRFMTPELLKQLQPHYPDIKSIKIIISRKSNHQPHTQLHSAKLTPTATKIITEFAEGVDDQTLKQALLRLGRPINK